MQTLNRNFTYEKANWFRKKYMFEEALIELAKINVCNLPKNESILYLQAREKLVELMDKNKFNGDQIDDKYIR